LLLLGLVVKKLVRRVAMLVLVMVMVREGWVVRGLMAAAALMVGL
jgi:hypothetical protein